MRRLPVAMTCAVGFALAGAAASVAPAEAADDHRTVRALGQRGELRTERLSDERRVSRYAGAVSRATVRARPSRRARRVGALHLLTEDGPFEVYPVLESFIDADGRTWLHIRLPARPNGQTGWVSRHALGPLRAVRTMLRVNRKTLRATLYRDGRRIWTSRVGVGARSTPTPAGRFWIRSRLRGLAGKPAYGPYAFGTGAYSVLSDWPGGGVIGIHGTDKPQLIPGRPVTRLHTSTKRRDHAAARTDANRHADTDHLATRQRRHLARSLPLRMRTRRIIEAMQDAAKDGRGAVSLDGRLIDAASLRQG